MNKIPKQLFPVMLTLTSVILALLVLRHLWSYYMDAPWTRDAHVTADIIQIAPDVSGLVQDVRVDDNQAVKQGDVLFVIDQERFRIALAQARANRDAHHATVEQLQREIARDQHLQDLVAAEEAEARRASLQAARAALTSAQADVDLAELELQRTHVLSPQDGHVNDRTVRKGDYVTAGQPVMALLETGSLRIDGYFEETRLHGVYPGQKVDIRLMGESQPLQGHVQSIAAGIEDRYRKDSSNLLPDVTPAFDWVRLAQRIPVRIAIDHIPAGVHLIAGRSATVTIDVSPQARRRLPAVARTSP